MRRFFHDITNSRDRVSQIIMVALLIFAAKYLPYLPNSAMTVAAIDRLVHHSTILGIQTQSFRKRFAESCNNQ